MAGFAYEEIPAVGTCSWCSERMRLPTGSLGGEPSINFGICGHCLREQKAELLRGMARGSAFEHDIARRRLAPRNQERNERVRDLCEKAAERLWGVSRAPVTKARVASIVMRELRNRKPKVELSKRQIIRIWRGC